MKISGNRFGNLHEHSPHTFWDVLRWKLHLDAPRPAVVRSHTRSATQVTSSFAVAVADRIRLTWIGHSTFLIQYRGRNILTDPIFGDCGPLRVGSFRRLTPPGIRMEDLPPIHDVLISHSHYDHLDAPAIRQLGNAVRFWVPAGLGNWFRQRGIAECRELGWWESEALSDEIAIHSVPAQHASGRTPFDRNRTHWCGWVLKSAERSIYFAGDSGYAPLFQEIGRRFGGVSLAMIPIGAYEPRWLMQPMHMNPAEAVQVHLDVGSQLSVACHWGTFRLTDEPLNAPPEMLGRELLAQNVAPESFLVLRPGVAIEV